MARKAAKRMVQVELFLADYKKIVKLAEADSRDVGNWIAVLVKERLLQIEMMEGAQSVPVEAPRPHLTQTFPETSGFEVETPIPNPMEVTS